MVPVVTCGAHMPLMFTQCLVLKWTEPYGIAYIAKLLHTLITQQRMYLNQAHTTASEWLAQGLERRSLLLSGIYVLLLFAFVATCEGFRNAGLKTFSCKYPSVHFRKFSRSWFRIFSSIPTGTGTRYPRNMKVGFLPVQRTLCHGNCSVAKVYAAKVK